MRNDKQNNKKHQREKETDVEFGEDIVDEYEKEMEAQSQEKRKGIQSIPFYRNG